MLWDHEKPKFGCPHSNSCQRRFSRSLSLSLQLSLIVTKLQTCNFADSVRKQNYDILTFKNMFSRVSKSFKYEMSNSERQCIFLDAFYKIKHNHFIISHAIIVHVTFIRPFFKIYIKSLSTFRLSALISPFTVNKVICALITKFSVIRSFQPI